MSRVVYGAKACGRWEEGLLVALRYECDWLTGEQRGQ